MKMRQTIIVGLLAAVGMGLAATPAEAGLDFPDVFQADTTLNSPLAAFNGAGAAVFNATNLAPNTFFQGGAGAGKLTLSSNAAAPIAVVLDLVYTSPAPDASGSYASTGAPADLIIDIGDVNGDGVVTLSGVAFSEDGGASFGITHTFAGGFSFTPAIDRRTHFFDIPTAIIPVATRDAVNVVRLTFILDPLDSIGINTVVNPEPGTVALFGLGLLGLAGVVRRRRKKRLDIVADAA